MDVGVPWDVGDPRAYWQNLTVGAHPPSPPLPTGVDRFKQSPCPVAGEYTGVIPDAPVLCAKLYSDCNNPEIMFYTVFSCYNRSEVIEGQCWVSFAWCKPLDHQFYLRDDMTYFFSLFPMFCTV